MSKSSKIGMHGFSDASQLAMAAVIYLTITDPSAATQTALLSAKSKVAPLKRLTIPLLELTAALISVKLVKYVKQMLDLTHVPIFLWTDSSCTLTWNTAHTSRWKEFFRNRVSLIQDLVPSGMWKYVPGRQNPADCASRGLIISQLAMHELWWKGPPWMIKQQYSWSNQDHSNDLSAHLEEQPGLLRNMTSARPEYHWEIIHRYSSLTRLLRVTSICIRVYMRMKLMPHQSLINPITPQDIDDSKVFWIKATQAAFFSNEIKVINRGSKLPPAHPFNRLTAYIDTRGVFVLEVDSPMHPWNLKLLIRLYFQEMLISLNLSSKMHTTELFTYAKRTGLLVVDTQYDHSSYAASSVLGIVAYELNNSWVRYQLQDTPARPFSVAEVDYAGPLTIRTWRGRGAKKTKGWLCVFVCFVTSAVHLEVATEYTTDSFIAAFRRFTGCRGACHTLHSDCGKNFEGAAPQLIQLITKGTLKNNHIFETLTNHGTTWKFNPPPAPHMGGKWEAAIVNSIFEHSASSINVAPCIKSHQDWLNGVTHG